MYVPGIDDYIFLSLKVKKMTDSEHVIHRFNALLAPKCKLTLGNVGYHRLVTILWSVTAPKLIETMCGADPRGIAHQLEAVPLRVTMSLLSLLCLMLGE